ncbi:hypothetical protein B0H10DRAFT_2246941, partial [Mycena sp. CBHHK59/15]
MAQTTNHVTDTAALPPSAPSQTPTPAGSVPVICADSVASLAMTVSLLQASPDGSFSEADTLNIDLGSFFQNAATDTIPCSYAVADLRVRMRLLTSLWDLLSPPPNLLWLFSPLWPLLTIPSLLHLLLPVPCRISSTAGPPDPKRELHSLTQQMARVNVDLYKHHAETAWVLEHVQRSVATNTHDVCTVNDCLEQLELTLTHMAATLLPPSSFQLPPILTAAPAPIIATPSTLPDVTLVVPGASSIDSCINNMEFLLQQLVSKCSRSPDASEDGRNVRTRIADSVLSGAMQSIAPAPAAVIAAAPTPVLGAPAPVLGAPAPIAPMPVLGAPAAVAPAPILGPPTPIVHAPVLGAPAPAPVLGAPAPVAATPVLSAPASAPPVLPPID